MTQTGPGLHRVSRITDCIEADQKPDVADLGGFMTGNHERYKLQVLVCLQDTCITLCVCSIYLSYKYIRIFVGYNVVCS